MNRKKPILPYPAMLVLLVITLLSALFYHRSGSLMEKRIQYTIRDSAALAAVSFTGEEIASLRQPADMDTPLFRSVVLRLQTLRATSPEFRYAYIMRKTDTLRMLAFVADADALNSTETLDANGDGAIDEEEESSLLGDLYDATEFPAMLHGFDGPSMDEDITVDQWGTFISGYAPIRNDQGEAVAILGLDMEAGRYLRESQRIFSPVLLLLVIAIGMLCAVCIEIFLVRRHAELRQELEEAKSRFLTTSSHQLRTPLASFAWITQCLLDEDAGKLTSKQKNLVADLQTCAQQLRKTVDTMLHVSSLESGKEKLQMSRVDVGELFSEVKTACKNEWGKKNIEVVIKRGSHVVVHTDRSIFTEAVAQLVMNAVQYTEPGGSITLSAKRAGSVVEIGVSDTGNGIPEHERGFIFQKFFRGESAVAKRSPGFGVGLYLVRTLVTMLRGTIRFSSETSVGTTFTVSLPDYN